MTHGAEELRRLVADEGAHQVGVEPGEGIVSVVIPQNEDAVKKRLNPARSLTDAKSLGQNGSYQSLTRCATSISFGIHTGRERALNSKISLSSSEGRTGEEEVEDMSGNVEMPGSAVKIYQNAGREAW
jgi:hypothetical protein